MNEQLAQHGQRFNDFAGGPGRGLHDGGGQDAGWWISSILAVLLLIAITGLLVWIGRNAADLRRALAPDATAVAAAASPAAVVPSHAGGAPAPAVDAEASEAPTLVKPDEPQG